MNNNSNNFNFESNNLPKQNNKSKKIIIIVLILLVVITIAVVFMLNKNDNKKTISSNKENSQNYHFITDEVNNNNKINNLIFRNKGIKLLDDLSDFVIQFKGLDCNLEIPNIAFEKKIDELDEDYINNLTVTSFNEDMLWDDNIISITCDSGIPGGDTEFKFVFEEMDSDNLGMLYKNRKIKKHIVYTPYETTIAIFSNGNIKLSIMDSISFEVLLEKFGKYNIWEYDGRYESRMIYYTDNYNISLYTYPDTEEEIMNEEEIYFHKMEIEYTK